MGLEALAAGDTLHDDLWDAGKTYMQMHHDKVMQSRSYNYEKKLNEQMASLASEARRDSAPAMVEGLKRAGLHPALASGAGFGSVSSGGSVGANSSALGAGGRSSQMGSLAVESLKYQESERALMDAQTANLNAEAEGKEIDNNNKLDANNASNKVARDFFSNILSRTDTSGEEKAFAKAMLSTPLSLGSLQGYQSALDSYSKESNAFKEKLKAQVDQTIYQSQLWDKEFASKVAGLGKEQVDNLKAQTANLAQSTALLEAELLRTKQDTEAIKKQMDLIGAQIRALEQTIRASKDSDLVGMWENGEYLKFAIGLGTSAFSTIAGSAIHAGGAYIGARTLLNGRSANPAFMRGLAQ